MEDILQHLLEADNSSPLKNEILGSRVRSVFACRALSLTLLYPWAPVSSQLPPWDPCDGATQGPLLAVAQPSVP